MKNMTIKEFEIHVRREWNNWNNTVHNEDNIDFVEWCCENNDFYKKHYNIYLSTESGTFKYTEKHPLFKN
jgi:hypothetical protein